MKEGIGSVSLLDTDYPKGYYKHTKRRVPQKYLDLSTLIMKYPHVLGVGNTGSGKGLFFSKQIENLYNEGYKIISIYNAGREIEHAYKKFRVEGKYAKRLRERGGKTQDYEIKVYCPVCKGFTPEKLPDFFELYTVPVANYPTINADLMSIINMVGLTEIGKDAINSVLGDFGEEDNLADLYYKIGRIIEEGYAELNLWFKIVGPKSRESMERIFFTLLKYRIMTDAKFELAMTDKKFQEIMNNQEEISVFTQAYTPKGLHPFFSLLPMQYVFENSQYCKHPILLVATEIQRIIRNPYNQRVNPAQELFSNNLVELVASGRKYNIHFMGDTQILSKIHPEFVSQALLIAFYTDIMDDKDLRAYGKKMLYSDELSDLKDTLHLLQHDPENANFEYFIPILNRQFSVELPSTAHPHEANKSDFLDFVRQKDKEEGWVSTVDVYTEIEEAIRRTVEESGEIKAFITMRQNDISKEFAELMDKVGGVKKLTPHMKVLRDKVQEEKAKGKTIEEVAKSLGYSVSHIYKVWS